MSTAVAVKSKLDVYLEELIQSCIANPGPGLLQDINKQAVEKLASSRLPDTKDEEWRFTDLSELFNIKFTPSQGVNITDASEFILKEAKNTRLVFVNGIYAPHLSDVSGLPRGVYAGNLSGLSDSQKTGIGKYIEVKDTDEEVLGLLNSAGLQDVAVIWAEENVVVETPIHLLYLSVAESGATISQPRGVIIASPGASLSLVEYFGARSSHCSDLPQNKQYWTNALTKVFVGENAAVQHTRVQRESGDGYHTGKSTIEQGRDSRYTCHEINLGAKLSRHTLHVFQCGENTQTNLNALTLIGGTQVSDTHTAIYLSHPGGTTNQLHKCIIDDRAHAIFNGKVFVPKPAQLTNAAQLNRNLLLSPKARINTKPELQITADNVKCSHGATVSQLEADEVFYLRSRGLNEDDARHLLIDAFAAEILDKLPLESLRQRLNQCLSCRTIDR
ncbi:MAG: FeS cluster assembly protein SufD [Chroococcopsis gigantea SAG 12.99]|jgi:Fe-S cluster assembly protein SufD|nr:Fe-S cluster assembly protein SufD [Chlorogloea purpurea SAG 13.99]MDV3000571.1 FeS cluster assembly protein SufD [Chroococcopsis gigantea SAG 12.99]